MKLNQSNLDRIIRVVIGLVFLVLFFTKTAPGTLGIVLLVLGIILLITGIIGFCGIYALLKISTNK